MATLTLPEMTFRRPRFGMALMFDLISYAEQASGLKKGSLYRHTRKQPIAYARFAVMKVAHERGRGLSLIARALGGMHHTSVMHGIKRAGEIEKTNQEFADLLWLLREVSY